jgi:hypothetical protein
MITILLLHRRVRRAAVAVTDRRSGVPAHRREDPLPRLRWY